MEATSATPAIARIWFVSLASWIVSGVCSVVVAWSMPEI